MKNLNYPNGNLLWNGQTLYFSDGKIAWHQNMGYYQSGQIASSGFKGFWKNGKVAWDGIKGYDDEGLFLTDFGVALRLNKLLVLLVNSREVEIDINNSKIRFTILKKE